MPEFQDFKSAFQWWLENVYPDLPSEEKFQLRYKKRDFLKNPNSVSDDKIQEILRKYFDVKLQINLLDK